MDSKYFLIDKCKKLFALEIWEQTHDLLNLYMFSKFQQSLNYKLHFSLYLRVSFISLFLSLWSNGNQVQNMELFLHFIQCQTANNS